MFFFPLPPSIPRSWRVNKIDISFILLSHVSNYFYFYLSSIPVYLIHCIRSLLTYSVFTLTPVKMWFAPQACNKTVHLVTPGSIEEAEYELIELETENRVSLCISWSMLLFRDYAVTLFIRQVETGPHKTSLRFSFSLIRSIALWHKHPTF